MTEIATAKTTIRTEFQKYDRNPSQATAIQAEDHAAPHAATDGSLGGVRIVLFSNPAAPVISGMLFSEVKIIAISGIRKKAALSSKTR